MPINGNFGGNTVLLHWKSQPRDLMTIFCAGHVTKRTQNMAKNQAKMVQNCHFGSVPKKGTFMK